jgi:uncharacterized protein (TIGR00661 family)
MKILYAVQATGNGHVSRAREIVPLLKSLADTDVLLSGRNAALQLPFDIRYRISGLGFVFGKQGGIDYTKSIRQANLYSLFRDIRQLPVDQYDIIISDFEPVSAWACRIKRKACIALSHQAAFLSNKTPRPEKPDLFTEWIFKYYSPSSSAYGFHFKPYDNSIYTPVIRKDIRALNPSDKNFYIVYLPAYGDELLMKYFHQFSDILIKIYSIHCKQKYTLKNVDVIPVNPQDFNQGFESCSGIITGGGFETPAEAIYLNKKMMVIPMRNQYEQICNAEALRQIGFPVLPAINKDFTLHLEKWFSNDFRYHEYYPDQTKEILMNIIEEHDPRYSGARQLQSG